MSETLDTKAQLCASLAAALVVYFENVPEDWEDHTLVLAKALARLTQEISGDIACGSFRPEEDEEDEGPVLGNKKLLHAVVDMLRRDKRALPEPVSVAELADAIAVLGRPAAMEILAVQVAAEPV